MRCEKIMVDFLSSGPQSMLQMCLSKRLPGKPAGLQEHAAKLGIRHQAWVLVLLCTATRFFQPSLLQSLPCRFGQSPHTDGAKSTGLPLLAVFLVATAELLFDQRCEAFQLGGFRVTSQVNVQGVSRLVEPFRGHSELCRA